MSRISDPAMTKSEKIYEVESDGSDASSSAGGLSNNSKSSVSRSSKKRSGKAQASTKN